MLSNILLLIFLKSLYLSICGNFLPNVIRFFESKEKVRSYGVDDLVLFVDVVVVEGGICMTILYGF